MRHFDVFNGDADGLCALHQLRLAAPLDSDLITGVKRDISLLDRVEAGAGDQVTVLDISFDKNRSAVIRLLDQGAHLHYYDHHYAGEIPRHPNLHAHIDTDSGQGTSLIVDARLGGAHRAWALVGTYGDNLDAAAEEAAKPLQLNAQDRARLRALGIYLNYNSYGATLADLFATPEQIFRRLQPYPNPLDFIAEDPLFAILREGYHDDLARAQALVPRFSSASHRLFILPCEPWARRVSGVFANDLAREAPEQAHAILTRNAQAGFLVSVRAPLARPDGADTLCRAFESGGGRKAAAGINLLPEADYDRFLEHFRAAFLGPGDQ